MGVWELTQKNMAKNRTVNTGWSLYVYVPP